MTDDLDKQRKRLHFRSVRRGTKESDLVIGGNKPHIATDEPWLEDRASTRA